MHRVTSLFVGTFWSSIFKRRVTFVIRILVLMSFALSWNVRTTPGIIPETGSMKDLQFLKS